MEWDHSTRNNAVIHRLGSSAGWQGRKGSMLHTASAAVPFDERDLTRPAASLCKPGPADSAQCILSKIRGGATHLMLCSLCAGGMTSGASACFLEAAIGGAPRGPASRALCLRSSRLCLRVSGAAWCQMYSTAVWQQALPGGSHKVSRGCTSTCSPSPPAGLCSQIESGHGNSELVLPRTPSSDLDASQYIMLGMPASALSHLGIVSAGHCHDLAPPHWQALPPQGQLSRQRQSPLLHLAKYSASLPPAH